jgi:hypothetical protein
MKLCGLVPNFYIYVCMSDLSIPTIGPQTKCTTIGGPIVGIYINRLQIHECRNREQDRSVSFLGIFVSNFRYSVEYTHSRGPIVSESPLRAAMALLI